MVECGSYLMIESQEDWNNSIEKREVRIDSDRFYCRGGYSWVFPVSFPCFYRHVKCMGDRGNGEWYPCGSYEAATFMNTKIIERISWLKEVQEKIKPLL